MKNGVCVYCIANEKRKQTNLKKYGVENPAQRPDIKEKTKKTNLDRYGVENPFASKNVKEKIRQTCLEKYNVEHPSQAQNVKDKTKQTCLKKYGTENPAQCEAIKEKTKQTVSHLDKNAINEKRKKTCLERYGVENVFQSEDKKEKIRQSNLEKYGIEYSFQNLKTLEKANQAFYEKYGVKNPSQMEAIRKKRRKTMVERYGIEHPVKPKYIFRGIDFDSKPELAFYVFHLFQEHDIHRNHDVFFEYDFEEKTHVYYPDFELDGVLYEIKGSQFLKEDGSWQNPYDHSMDNLYEAKHQCALKNGVHIVYEYQRFVDFIEKNYGKDYLEEFKIK